RRDRRGPDDAVVVEGHLDAGLHGAGDADAVAAHDGGVALLLGVHDVQAHRLGVLRAELEDVPDLDAAAGLEPGRGVAGRGIAREGVADVGDADAARGGVGRREGEAGVAGPAEVRVVVVGLVRARGPRGPAARRVRVDEEQGVRDRGGGAGGDVADGEAGGAGGLLVGELHREPGGVADLALVDLVVAADDGEDPAHAAVPALHARAAGRPRDEGLAHAGR